ncbi:MAG: GNAT family N-acetyltransferase [Bacteroidales bacterium]|nr:GNAT family N-acetyltransferase [Bacteroidales bacterium]
MEERDLEIKFCDFSDGKDLERLIATQNEVYRQRGLKFTPEDFGYWYADNPEGRVISFNAMDGDRIVAHEALVPELMEVDGRTVKCLRSMGSVTLPEYRGRKLLAILTNKCIEEAQKRGYEFVYGIANGNSIHTFLKYCGFSLVGKLDVKFGFGKIREPKGKVYRRAWTPESLAWRTGNPKNFRRGNLVLTRFKPGVSAVMGTIDESLLDKVPSLKKGCRMAVRLYVGMGADVPPTFLKVPKFVKHSPFNLIFRDLTGGQIPQMTSSNLFYQLMDFDVA